MSTKRQMLIDHNIDDVLVGKLVQKSNSRLRIIDQTKKEPLSKVNEVNKVLRKARDFWLLENKKSKLN